MNERFARHDLIADWRQDDLGAATVAIAGVGAIGNCVAQTLALTGVGRLILCDADVVALSNLSRTPLFGQGDIGRPKVAAAADRLRALAPGTAVETRATRFESAIGLGELRDDVTLVMGCLDSRSARLELAGRCAFTRTRSIDSATQPWGGEVRPFLAPDGPCFSCSLSEAQRGVADRSWSCLDLSEGEPQGAAAPSSGLIGAWASLLAVRALCGAEVSPETIVIDAAHGALRKIATARDPRCMLHRSIGETVKLKLDSSATVAALRAAGPTNAVPLLWRPSESGALCGRCGWQESGWREARPRPCPRCGEPLLLDTTLELSRIDGDVSLERLGVPDREILAARTPGGITGLNSEERQDASKTPPGLLEHKCGDAIDTAALAAVVEYL